MTSRPFSGPFDNQHLEIQRLSAILGFFLLLNTITKNKRAWGIFKKKVQTSQQHGYLKIAEHVCREFTDIYIIILVLYLSVWSGSDKVMVMKFWFIKWGKFLYNYSFSLLYFSQVNLFLCRKGIAKAMESPIFFLEKISWANVANLHPRFWGHCYLLALPNYLRICGDLIYNNTALEENNI